MLEHALFWIVAVLGILWLVLHRLPKIGGFINVAAPLGIVVCLIAASDLFKAKAVNSASASAPISAPAPAPAAIPPPAPTPSVSTANVRPQGEVNMRLCPGTDCEVIAQLRRSSRVSLSGKAIVVETSTGALLTWAEVSTTGGDYCLPANLESKAGCRAWQQQPLTTGWMNMTFLRPE